MIAAMDRVEIVFLRSELKDMVTFLQNAGIVHLEEVPLAVENHPGYLHRVHLPEEERADLQRLEQLDTMLKESTPLLSAKPAHADIAAAGPGLESLTPDQLEREVRIWHRTLRSFTRRRLNIQDNIELIQAYSRVLQTILPMLKERGVELGKTARAMILDGYSEDAVDALEKRCVESIGSECQFVRYPLDRNREVAVLTHGKDKAGDVAALLKKEGISPLDAPDRDFKANTVLEVLEKAGSRTAELYTALERIEDSLKAFTEGAGASVFAAAQLVSSRKEQLAVVDKFAQSDMVGVVHGWVPKEEYDNFHQALKKEFGSRVEMGRLSMEDVELKRVPTLRKNHPIFKPFELILSLMKPPVYGSFDPTAVVACSFIMFYGFVLGDSGYGALMVLIGWWVKSKWGHISLLKDAMTIFQWMGVSSIVWGLIYFEIFGNFAEKVTGIHPIFHRAHETETLLYMAIMFGVVHIPLSLILGIREGFNHHHEKHAYEKLGMLLGLVALAAALAGGSLPGTLGSLLLIGAAVLFLACVFYLIKGMGVMMPMGVMELLGLSANVLSYARLMALGIASIAFAEIANQMVEGSTGFVFILLLLGAMAIHVLNIGIGIFSPTIHSLRLNLVEFLPKFYEPAGRSYEPFRKEMAW
jgi:V/A-type H+-transporting ATPase subunit I